MLSGRYPSDQFAELRPRLVWDRLRGVARPSRCPGAGGRQCRHHSRPRAVRGLPRRARHRRRRRSQGGPACGRARRGDGLREPRGRRLRARAPRAGASSRSPATGCWWRPRRASRAGCRSGRPTGRRARWSWAARSAADARAGRGTRAAAERRLAGIRSRRRGRHNLLDYLDEQRQATGALPDDRTLVLERTRDELGDWRLCLLSPWGGRVHAPWALAIEAHLRARARPRSRRSGATTASCCACPIATGPPTPRAAARARGDRGAGDGAARLHRRCSPRASARRRGGPCCCPVAGPASARRCGCSASAPPTCSRWPPASAPSRSCSRPTASASRTSSTCPAWSSWPAVRSRAIRLLTVDTTTPSPFSASLLFGYVANYLYDGDAPLAERRAHALSVDQRQLRELLGEAELRELLDPEALDELETPAPRPRRRAQGPRAPIASTSCCSALGDLKLRRRWRRGFRPPEPNGRARQLLPSTVAGRWTKALACRQARGGAAPRRGEAPGGGGGCGARFRDALGTALPTGLPRGLPRARTEGAARRPGGALRPHPRALHGGRGRPPALRSGKAPWRPSWCGCGTPAGCSRASSVPVAAAPSGAIPGYWRRCAGRSLSRLRRQVEPAEPTRYARFVLAWHGVESQDPAAGEADALLDVIERLQGRCFRPRRSRPTSCPLGFRTTARGISMRCAPPASSCGWAWRRSASTMAASRCISPIISSFSTLRRSRASTARSTGGFGQHLSRAGASFFAELHAAAGGGLMRPVLEALWDLVWAGEVTNDTLGPLRSFLFGRRSQRRASRRLAALRSRRAAPASAGGRWSLVARLRQPTPPSPTERLTALAGQLLALPRRAHPRRRRCRKPSLAASSALYPVLTALEEQGPRAARLLPGRVWAARSSPSPEPSTGCERHPRSGPQDSDGVGRGAGRQRPGPARTAPRSPGRASGTRLARTAGAATSVLVDGRLAAYLAAEARDVAPFLPEDEPARSRVGRGAATRPGGLGAPHGPPAPRLGRRRAPR